ncbi:nuclear transport factor 2 family protein [Pedobacter sp. NJ-S-72]
MKNGHFNQTNYINKLTLSVVMSVGATVGVRPALGNVRQAYPVFLYVKTLNISKRFTTLLEDTVKRKIIDQMDNKAILEKANMAIIKGNYEEFLSFCTDDTKWTFVGEQTLWGKEQVRQYMATAYKEPPKFIVEKFIAEDEFVTAVGKISMKNGNGTVVDYSYCDIWRFRDGKMVELTAFVIEN